MRRFLLISVIILLTSVAFADSRRITAPGVSGAYVPVPRLIAPTREKINLSGRRRLLFKWSPHEGDLSQRRYYDFRLYKGYDMPGSTLIFKKRIPSNTYQIDIDTDLFEDNQVYAWSLRQVYSSRKSRRSYSSFRVIKE